MSVSVIWWLRNDLRLADNPALCEAVQAGRVVPLYVHAPEESAPWLPGAATRWWLHHSLAALADDLAARGSRLVIRRGPSLDALRAVCAETGARAVYWNRRYEPAHLAVDKMVKAALAGDGVTCHSSNGALLVEPWAVRTGAGGPYRVFTPYFRAARAATADLAPRAAPRTMAPVPVRVRGLPLGALELLPRVRWYGGLADTWQPGESGARVRLAGFARVEPVTRYPVERDVPASDGTARLSPHLHFGEVSPRQLLAAVQRAQDAPVAGVSGGAETWVRQLYWREFAHHLLFHFPRTPDHPLDRRFEDFAWQLDEALARAWTRGMTGIPLVDAGMRELWTTGWMHNRVRMLTASLLTKHGRIPWQAGARWFWDTLVDADLANNTLGWQWCAGCGADAAPYFRIFNPVTQGERFDPRGAYVRRWVPELARMPDRWIHRPHLAPAPVQEQAGVRLGVDYPRPVIDLAEARELALGAYRACMAGSGR